MESNEINELRYEVAALREALRNAREHARSECLIGGLEFADWCGVTTWQLDRWTSRAVVIKGSNTQ